MKMKKSYFYREIFMFKAAGVSLTGKDSTLYKVYAFIVLFVFDLPYPFLASGEFFKNDFESILDAAPYTIGCYIGVLETIVILKNRKQILSLLNKLQDELFQPNSERGGEGVENRIINRCLWITGLQTKMFYGMMVLIAIPGGIYTLSKRIKSSDYHDWEFQYGPLTVLNVTYSPNFEISWFYQWFAMVTTGYNAISTTLITTSLLSHIATRFEVLQNFLRRIVDYSYIKMMKKKGGLPFGTEMLGNDNVDASKIPWDYLQESLKEVLVYHMTLADFTTETIELFSELILYIYFVILSVQCLLVYNASVLDFNDTTAIMKVAMGLVATLVQLFLISYWGEQVFRESEKLQIAAYEANFVGADLRFQKGLSLIIRRCQNPIKIKAGKIVETSMVTFVWLLRASYSSLMVLRKRNSG